MATPDSELKRGYEAVQQHLQQMKDAQTRKNKHIEMLNQLGAQRNENELVKDELTRIEPNAAVYKLIGPALVSQDVDDAKHVVTRRLEHINAEMRRLEAQIAEAEKVEDSERDSIIALQKSMSARQQALQQGQQQAQQQAQAQVQGQ